MKIYIALVFALICNAALAGNATQLINETPLQMSGHDDTQQLPLDRTLLTSGASQLGAGSQLVINEAGSYNLSYQVIWDSVMHNLQNALSDTNIDGTITVTTFLSKNGTEIIDSSVEKFVVYEGSETHIKHLTLPLDVSDYVELNIRYDLTDASMLAHVDVDSMRAILTAEINRGETAPTLAKGAVNWNRCHHLETTRNVLSTTLYCLGDNFAVVGLSCEEGLVQCRHAFTNAISIRRSEVGHPASATIKCCEVIQ